MFRKLLPFCLGFILWFGSLSYAESYTPKVGEALHYKLMVKSMIHGANQTIKVVSKGLYNGREVMNIQSRLESTGLLKQLINYSEMESIVLDIEGMYPWYIKREVHNRQKEITEEVTFDYEHNRAIRTYSKNDGTKVCSEISLPGFVQDGLSLQYFLRRGQYQKGQNKIYFYSNGFITENFFEASEINEAIKLECGSFPKYAQIIDDLRGITILVADFPERYPLIIKMMADYGKVEAKLYKIE